MTAGAANLPASSAVSVTYRWASRDLEYSPTLSRPWMPRSTDTVPSSVSTVCSSAFRWAEVNGLPFILPDLSTERYRSSFLRFLANSASYDLSDTI